MQVQARGRLKREMVCGGVGVPTCTVREKGGLRINIPLSVAPPVSYLQYTNITIFLLVLHQWKVCVGAHTQMQNIKPSLLTLCNTFYGLAQVLVKQILRGAMICTKKIYFQSPQKLINVKKRCRQLEKAHVKMTY